MLFFVLFFRDGVNDVAKRCSTPSARGQRQRRNKAAGNNNGGTVEDKQQIAVDHAEVARSLVLAAWAEIVGGLIKKAADGGYQQAKLLLELCGLESPDATELDNRRTEQLCDILLERMVGSSPARAVALAPMDDGRTVGNQARNDDCKEE